LSYAETRPMEDLHGRIAVVTGGGRGIGRAITLALAAAGMTVVSLARSVLELEETRALAAKVGDRAEGLSVDITNRAAVEAAIAQVQRDYGGLHVLVNNAAQVGPIGPFHQTEVCSWWAAMEVNLLGAIHCTRAAAPGMVSRRSGRIINIVTSAVPLAYLSSYIVSKTALIRLTEIVGSELQPYGVSVIALIPGTTRTAMAEHSLRSPEGRRWIPWFKSIFAQGLDVPVEVPANYVVQLASGRGDALTGRTVSIGQDLDTLSKNDQLEAGDMCTLRLQGLTRIAGGPIEAIRREGERGFQVLKIERTFMAPPDVVLQLWLDPTSVRSWFAHQCGVHWSREPRIQARLGGQFDWEVVSDTNPTEVFHFRGTYLRIESGSRLVFSWNWENLPIDAVDGPGSTHIDITVVAEGNSTKLTLLQKDIPSPAARLAHLKGWNRCLDGIWELIEANR
jgi:NAD(P)-dependent dehydrogenase (short-subunit alcohol dehydrogenase family)/uncharacterized protein YndB with AHSA1/START domain